LIRTIRCPFKKNSILIIYANADLSGGD